MAELVDPTVCLTPAPPKLGLAATPDSATAFELMATARVASMAGEDAPKPPVAPVQAFVDRRDSIRVRATIGAGGARGDRSGLSGQARGDRRRGPEQPAVRGRSRARRGAAVQQMGYQFELPIIGPRGQAAIKRAEAAVARVAQPDLTAHIEFARSMIESQDERWADACRALAARRRRARRPKTFTARRVRGALEEIELHFARSRPEDYAAARALVARWLPLARSLHDDNHLRKLERADAYARYSTGVDIAAARADLVRCGSREPHLVGPHRRIEGDVVDAAGKPVAGAMVAAARQLTADGERRGPAVPAASR